MPKIAPPGGVVDWPATEGALGVVGVAPWATLDFCRALYGAVSAQKDWHFPRLLLDINTKIPSRGRHLQLGETDPSGAIAATIDELARQGATIAVVVCNTAHILYERWARNAPIPVLHIIDETVRAALESGAKRATALGSASLAKANLYAHRASALGLSCSNPTADDQAVVDQLIAAIKLTGGLDAPLRQAAGAVLTGLKSGGVDTVIGGCTELSLLESSCAEVGMRFVDSNVALGRAALNRLGLPAGRIEPATSGGGPVSTL
jgi:aspartate racemase